MKRNFLLHKDKEKMTSHKTTLLQAEASACVSELANVLFSCRHTY